MRLTRRLSLRRWSRFRLGGAKVDGHAVLDDAVLLEDAVEDFERTAGVDHEIFGDDLEPVAGRFLFENVTVVGNTQAETDTVVGRAVERVGGHGMDRS